MHKRKFKPAHWADRAIAVRKFKRLLLVRVALRRAAHRYRTARFP